MALSKPVRWSIYIVCSLVALLTLALGILSLVSIPIDLTPYKNLAEPIVSKAVGRKVTIDGRVNVTTSLWPTFAMEGLRVANPEGFDGDFAVMRKARIQVSVLPLLLFKAHINEFMVEGLTLDLREKADGSATWHVTLPEDESDKSALKLTKTKGSGFVLSEDSLVLESLDIRDISVGYSDASMEVPTVFIMEKWTGRALSGKPFEMEMNGSVMDHQFTASIRGASLKKFLETSRTQLKIALDIARTRLELGGMFDFSPEQRTLGLEMKIQGDRLDSLNSLTGLRLPRIEDYEAESQFVLRKDRIEMKDFLIRVGSSRLTGLMTIDNSGVLPVADLKFTAPSIDIQDFLSPDFGQDQNATLAETGTSKENEVRSEVGKTKVDKRSGDRLLSPAVLNAFQADLDVKVESVTSGKDILGSGHLKARVKDGVFTLDPVVINIPGGSFFFALSAREGAASVRAVVEDFDFGVITRMYKPDTDMGGTLSLNVALESKTETLDGLLANANGYLDFIFHPRNLHAGIVDLWAVNLMAAILSKNSDDKGSVVNCAVARMIMNDGYLTPDVFVIDTTVMRICGRGRVDFKRKRLDLDVRPSAKKAEYFSLATPLAVHGTFDDFQFGIARGGVFGTVVGFITSPIYVTARRLGGSSAMPLDGSDICSMIIGAKDRPTGPPKGCLPALENTRHK
ncbi:MAG: AsmA family protein [Pseudodesulfovibrio sp.]|nr:AsmA family protein [Pseudodesulfovibrio sp.]